MSSTRDDEDSVLLQLRQIGKKYMGKIIVTNMIHTKNNVSISSAIKSLLKISQKRQNELEIENAKLKAIKWYIDYIIR